MQPRCAQQPNYAVQPTGNVLEIPELGTPRYKEQNCWFPMVSTIEGIHCMYIKTLTSSYSPTFLLFLIPSLIPFFSRTIFVLVTKDTWIAYSLFLPPPLSPPSGPLEGRYDPVLSTGSTRTQWQSGKGMEVSSHTALYHWGHTPRAPRTAGLLIPTIFYWIKLDLGLKWKQIFQLATHRSLFPKSP